MAKGDQNDIFSRLISLLPNGWFSGDENPILGGILQGIANAHAFVYSALTYATLQARIKTATDGFLDLISIDFFGDQLPRWAAEKDKHFLSRILLNLFRERATRFSLIDTLFNLTGITPKLVELRNPEDCGGYSMPLAGYGQAGHYGSIILPFQAFLIAYRPLTSGIPLVCGYGDPCGGYGVASQIEYASLSMIEGDVTDADILAAINNVKPEGTIIWTNIQNYVIPAPAGTVVLSDDSGEPVINDATGGDVYVSY